MRTDYHRGDVVELLAYGQRHLIRRVWRDSGRGVAICSEEAYQQALASGEEPRCVGWPREDVLAVLTPPPEPRPQQGGH